MSRADLHTLTGAYAANALPTDEEAAFVAHLVTCEACTTEVAELQATAARLAAASAQDPPPALRAAVLGAVSTTRQLRPRGRLAGLAPEVWPTWMRTPATLAAALLLVVALGLAAVTVSEAHRADRNERLARDIAAVVGDPAHQTVARPMPGGGTGTLVTAHGHAVFLASGMPPAPAGKTYQLWLMAPGNNRSVGLIVPRGGSAQTYLPSYAGARQVGVSVEPAGGSRQPTTTPVLVLDVSA